MQSLQCVELFERFAGRERIGVDAGELLQYRVGRGFFRFRGRTYGAPEDGVAFAIPSPWNPRRMVYVYSANTRLQLWQMTKAYQRGLPGWAIWKGAEVISRGYHGSAGMTVDFK